MASGGLGPSAPARRISLGCRRSPSATQRRISWSTRRSPGSTRSSRLRPISSPSENPVSGSIAPPAKLTCCVLLSSSRISAPQKANATNRSRSRRSCSSSASVDPAVAGGFGKSGSPRMTGGRIRLKTNALPEQRFRSVQPCHHMINGRLRFWSAPPLHPVRAGGKLRTAAERPAAKASARGNLVDFAERLVDRPARPRAVLEKADRTGRQLDLPVVLVEKFDGRPP